MVAAKGRAVLRLIEKGPSNYSLGVNRNRRTIKLKASTSRVNASGTFIKR